MPQPPLPSPNRLNKLEKTHARERRVFFIWKDPGDTAADVEAKRHRLIAEGNGARGRRIHSHPLASPGRKMTEPRDTPPSMLGFTSRPNLGL